MPFDFPIHSVSLSPLVTQANGGGLLAEDKAASPGVPLPPLIERTVVALFVGPTLFEPLTLASVVLISLDLG